MDWTFDARRLPPGKGNPHNEFGAPLFDKPPQAPWGQSQRASWVNSGGPSPVTTWTWKTPVFDLRPEYVMRADTEVTAGVPINHQGTYGIGTILQVIIGGQPANLSDLTVEWWELGDTIGGGNPATAAAGLPLLMLSRPEDITTELLAGGITVAGQGEGGTLFQFDPPGCRFWQLVLQFKHALAQSPALHVRATLGV